MIRVRCLWLRPGILAETVAREGAQRVQRVSECVRLFLRNRAPAGNTAQSLSVKDREHRNLTYFHRKWLVR
jgi:hypothetical protein